LHTRVYEKTFVGEGFGIKDARPSIELTHRIRTSPVVDGGNLAHPYLKNLR
jgi:UDP-N-acetyl-2-amino-2-deoxyglucuronate dehydrogenase